MRLRHDPEADWERFGSDEPYYGVYADARFRRQNLDGAALAEFFVSGERHVAAVVETIERSLDPGFAPKRALELGCGVGRILIPIARRCAEVVGVDVSTSMLAEARRNLDERGLANVTLVHGDEALSEIAGPFDWIHCFIVLQHVPRPRGERLVARLIDLLAEGGVGVLHVTFSNELSLRSRLARWARGALPGFHPLWNWRHGKGAVEPWMQMNRYDLNRIYRLLQDGGCHRSVARFTNHFGYRGVVLFVGKGAEPSFP